MFQAPKLTNAGKALYYDNMAGAQLKFTTIKLGSGTLSGSIANLTNLVNTVVTIAATATKYEDYANVAGSFSNAQLAEGFYWREIGVFAADPSDPDNRAADILYCYQNAYDTADFIPVASVETVEKNITVPVIVGDATAVSCTLSKSLVFVTQQDLEDQKGGANGLASLDANGKITPAQVDYLLKTIVAAADYDPTATYAVGAYCTHEGTLYKCTTAITAAEAWNAAHWAATTVAAELLAIIAALAGKADWNDGFIQSGSILDWAESKTINTGIAVNEAVTGVPYPSFWAFNLYIYPAGGWRLLTALDIASEKQYYIMKNLNNPWGTWKPFATATPPTEYDLPLLSGYTKLFATNQCNYSKDQFGYVHVKGSYAGTFGWNTLFASLPEDCRPPEGTDVLVNATFANGTGFIAGRVFVNDSGGLYSVVSPNCGEASFAFDFQARK